MKDSHSARTIAEREAERSDPDHELQLGCTEAVDDVLHQFGSLAQVADDEQFDVDQLIEVARR